MEPFTAKPPANPAARPHRPLSLYLVTIGGIPIFIHFTLFIMLVFIGWFEFAKGERLWGGLVVVIGIFASIALHELGHALVAKRFGIETEDIVLYPIGGVARLRSMGEGVQELWIALAGPAVNVAIALILFAGLLLTGNLVSVQELYPEAAAAAERAMERAEGESSTVTRPRTEGVATGTPHYLQHIMMINIILVLFNMIPAFPMDGGRVLRALLTQITSKEKATAVAATLGKGLALVFMVMGAMGGNFLLLIVGIFVLPAASQEHAVIRSTALMSNKKVRDAMIRHFEVLNHGDSLGKAADLLLSTSQHEFPVMGGGSTIGVLTRNALIKGLAEQGRDHYVAEVMAREFPRIGPDEDLAGAFAALREGGGVPLMVFEGDRLVGFVNGENIAEYLMIAQSRREEKG